MLRHTLLLSLTLASVATSAQSALPSNGTPSSVVLKSLPTPTGCPISLQAQRQGSSQILLADRGDTLQPGPVQGLHLTLNHPDTPAIDSIEVTVYATSTAARVIPLNSVPRNQSDTISKTFALHRDNASASLKEADVWMHQVGSLRWVDLISINYTNGATWHATLDSICRVEPSNFVLVGQR